MDSLALLSEVFNYDFARHRPDEPLSDEVMASMTGLRGFLDRVIQLSGNPNPSLNDFVRWSGRGRCGSSRCSAAVRRRWPTRWREWFASESCDGFVLAATHMPGAYEDFARLVAPELQRRGLFRRDYAPGTLRDNLGLARPARG